MWDICQVKGVNVCFDITQILKPCPMKPSNIKQDKNNYSFLNQYTNYPSIPVNFYRDLYQLEYYIKYSTLTLDP